MNLTIENDKCLIIHSENIFAIQTESQREERQECRVVLGVVHNDVKRLEYFFDHAHHAFNSMACVMLSQNY